MFFYSFACEVTRQCLEPQGGGFKRNPQSVDQQSTRKDPRAMAPRADRGRQGHMGGTRTQRAQNRTRISISSNEICWTRLSHPDRPEVCAFGAPCIIAKVK